MVNDSLHQLAEVRSLAYHAQIAESIQREPTLLEAVLDRLREQARYGDTHQRCTANARLPVVEKPLADALRLLTEPGERATALR